MGTVRVIRKLRLLFDVVFTRPDASPVQDGDVVTYVAAQDKFFLATSGGGPPTGAAGGVLGGTYPNPSFAVDMATQAELDAHINNATDAHDASAISVLDAASDFTATDVEGALAELQSDHEADATALADHIADASAAHAASAIAFTPAGTIAATDVQAAIEEVASVAAGGGAPTTADYLVGTAQAGLSAEIMVGTSPGGELGGTWASPTVDATHSGSSHAAVQAAAEATAQAALDAHLNDTADAHDASAISVLDAANDFTATDVEGALAELQSDHEADAQALADHLADTSDAHDASAISILDAANDFTATDVEGALAELQADAEADATALSDHIADPTAAHAATAVSVDSTTLSGTGTTVQASLEELDNLLDDHSARHENGGADEISVAGLSGELADAQPVAIADAGSLVGTRSRINFIEGTNVTLTIADDAGNDEVDVTIAATGGSTAADDESLILHMEAYA